MVEASRCVGFIGLGKMGRPMAENLARSPTWDVLVHDRVPAAVAAFRQHPDWGTRLQAAASLQDFARCQVVITMLPDSSFTNAILLGQGEESGLRAVLAPGSLILDMGSSDPVDTVQVAERLAVDGLRLIDAPVSGSVVKALSGQLSIMVGAAEDEAASVDDILRWIGTTIIHTGQVGSAHAMKTLNNYVYSAGLLAVCEALLIARKMKLDETILAEVLNVSSGKNFAAETKLRQFILPRSYNGGFALRLMAKDVGIADRLRQDNDVAVPQLTFGAAFWRDALAALPADADTTEVYRFLEARQTTGETR